MNNTAITIGDWYSGTALSKDDESKMVREAFGLPLTKALVYYKNDMNVNSKCMIRKYRVLQTFNISDFWAIIELETEDGYTVKIHSMYLKQMQNPIVNEQLPTFELLSQCQISTDVPTSLLPLALSDSEIIIHKLTNQQSVQKIYYISDIHIEHHLFWEAKMEIDKYFSIFNKAIIIQEWLKKKIQEMISEADICKNDLLLIGGDVSDSVSFSKLFYRELRSQWHGTIISILGNHELWNGSTFDDWKNENFRSSSIETIVNEYKQIHSYNDYLLENELFILYKGQKSRIVSQNEIMQSSVSELTDILSKCTLIILGGLGYSGLNTEYNAEYIQGIRCQTGMGLYRKAITSVQEDKRRSELFRNIYEKVLKCSCEKQIIILTHTPIKDWTSDKPISGCIYVNGHTHRNKIQITADGVAVLSDNQIGYGIKKENVPNSILPKVIYYHPKWKLKSFIINHLWYDPFENRPDGIYVINSEEYKDFNRGRGIESNGCNYKGTLYMLKRNGIYMFLIKSSRSLCLLSGGKRSKLVNKDIQYYFEKMTVYNERIRKMIKPYQNMLQKLSNEVKKIGGSGTVHGCIIDIDWFNHIYLNPFDGKITSYFAYDMCSRCLYNNIQEHIETKLPQLLPRYLQECTNHSIPHLETSMIEAAQKAEIMCLPKWMFGTEIYAPSRVARSIQYIWEQNVIRIWNEDILNDLENSNLQIS